MKDVKLPRDSGSGPTPCYLRCYAGKVIYPGDVLTHPSGELCVVEFWDWEEENSDKWRVRYQDNTVGRLCLQVGDKGQAVNVSR